MNGDRRPTLALLVGLFAPAGALIGHALVHALAASRRVQVPPASASGGRWWALAGAVALLLAVAAALRLLVGRANARGGRPLLQRVHSLEFSARLWWRLAMLQLVVCAAASVTEALVVAPGLKNPLHALLLPYAALAQSVTALLVAAIVRVVAAWAWRLCRLPVARRVVPLADPWRPRSTRPVRRRLSTTVPLGLRAPPVSS